MSEHDAPHPIANEPRILLLHGLLSGSVAWDGLRRELGPGVRTIAPDLPGYGRNFADTATTFDEIVDRLSSLVERERPEFIVGHSMGGIIAMALARRFPGEVRRVGVIALPIFSSRKDGHAFIHQRGFAHKALLHTDYVSHLGCAAVYKLRPVWLPLVPVFSPRQPVAHAAAAFRHTRASHSGNLNHIIFAGLVPRLARRLPVPVAALHGGRDPSAPLARVRELGAAFGWDVRVAPTANHQVAIERPRLAARWVREVLLAAAAPGP